MDRHLPDRLSCLTFLLLFFNDTATTEIYTLSLHDALPISWRSTSVSTPLLRKRSRKRPSARRSEEHTSELQSHDNLACRLLLEKKNKRQVAERPPGRGSTRQDRGGVRPAH